MAKNSIRDFSATAGSNTDIQSVNIDENCPASGINNAIRELMVDLKNVSTGAVNLETPGADQLNVDNIRIDGNTISSTDTNGDITLDPNGTGKVAVPAAIEATTSTHANASVFKSTGNTQLFLQDTDATANDQFWGFQVSGGDFNILTCNDDRASGFLTPIVIDSSGNVGIGETSPLGTLHVRTSDASLTSVNANADELILENNGNCGMSICSSTTGEGNINFIDSGDSNIGRIQYTHSDNKMGFRVNDTAVFFVEGDRITVRTAPAAGVNGVDLRASDSSGGRIRIAASGTGGYHVMQFFNTNGQVGSIGTSGTSTSFNTSSDHRLKENVADMTGAITRVKQLAPKRFNFIADADTTVDGFLAHEAQAVVPEAVSGTYNEVDDDGNAVMQGIDQSKLVPLLTGALQEAITKIETLETEMTALKARVTALEA